MQIGFLSLLGLMFILLKLLGIITWSWWWVTLPVWGPSVIVCTFLFVMLITASIVESVTK